MAFYTVQALWDWIDLNYDELIRFAARTYRVGGGGRVVGLTPEDLLSMVLVDLVSRNPNGLAVVRPLLGYVIGAMRLKLKEQLRASGIREHEPLEVIDLPLRIMRYPGAE